MNANRSERGGAVVDGPGTAAQRAGQLLGRMTLAEKSQQLCAVFPAVLSGSQGLRPDRLQQHLGAGIGHISMLPMLGSAAPQQIAESVNAIQRYLVEQTRLGIPAIFHNEALNGFVAPGYTSFPTAIGLAATWEPQLVTGMTDVIRRQMRSVGILQALSPVMDVARDARWGRVHETYGEDVYLVSAMSVAFVRGLHGDSLSAGVLATGKHFLGYALSEGGLNTAATHLGDRELYDVYATPFEAAIQVAGLSSVMNSYSEIDGVPAGANSKILTDLLRDRMGFTGSVVSDYMTVQRLHTTQQVAASAEQAGALAVSAGLDVELPTSYGFGSALLRAVQDGLVEESVIDTAVRRVLVNKFELGLFENPYVEQDSVAIGSLAGEGADLSRTLAEKSVTLLKNDGVLPLSKEFRNIAVIGPHADGALVNFAAYTYPAALAMMKAMAGGDATMAGMDSVTEGLDEMSDNIAGLAKLINAVDPEAIARDGYGALSLADAIRVAVPDAAVQVVAGSGVRDADPDGLAAAVRAAETADVVVFAIGGCAGWIAGNGTEGEGIDSADIDLPSAQTQLVKAVAGTGTPCVAVVYLGRPYGLAAVDEHVAALLTAYYPGPCGGPALAAALFGDINPGGKLPYTLPRSTGQVPIYHAKKPGSAYRGGAAQRYGDLSATPLYPFGHGLSYTTFVYGEVGLSAAEIGVDGAIEASSSVRNAGGRDGDEVIQLYCSHTATGVTRPTQRLVGFVRAQISAGAAVRVTFRIAVRQLGYTGVDGRFIFEPGPVTLSIGSSSSDLRSHKAFTVLGSTVDLSGRRTYLSEATIRNL